MNADLDLDFNIVYEKYYPKIYNYAYYRLINKEDAEDIVSEVFLKALNGISRFDGKRADISTWLFRIAANAVNDHFRRLKKAAFIPIEDAEPFLPDSDSNSMSDDMIHAEDMQKLGECLKLLDDRTRGVLALRYWGEFSYAGIAAQTGLSEKNVSVILIRGINRLKILFEKKF